LTSIFPYDIDYALVPWISRVDDEPHAMNTSQPLLIVAMIALLIPAPALSVSATPKKGAALSPVPSKKGDPSKGKVLYRHYCAVCHGVAGRGDGPNAEYLDPRPADLSDAEYMAGATEQTIFAVIERGGAALDLPSTMPVWGKTFSKEQILDLVAYVQTLSKSQPMEKKSPTRLEEIRAPSETQCRLCHVKQGEHRQIAPDLGQEGSKLNKDWVYAFLKKPTKVRPVGFIPLTKSVMPNFQLTDEEVLSLTEYLMTKKDPRISKAAIGEIRMIPGEIQKGKKLFLEAYSCDACHRIGDNGGIVGPNLAQAGRRLRPEWIATWLKNPQAIRRDSPMPNLGLQENEIRALVSYILSVTQGPTPAPTPATSKPINDLIQKGEMLMKDKNCIGCHVLETEHDKERGPRRTAEGLSVYSNN